ncbi:hypothetical protein [Nitrososphaera sp.]|uniref:hypothetical protein n=1 Tax=Nitrososphaera sp. TaxID=1971748 RepID=UPI00307FBFB3
MAKPSPSPAAGERKQARSNNRFYDDEKLENMVRYYKIEDNFDSLLNYIKRRGLVEDEAR